MRGEPTDFWAKLEHDEAGNTASWHPLIDHCIDVGLVFKAICSSTKIRNTLASLVGQRELTEVQIDRLSFFATLHDLGKLNNGFQNRAKSNQTFLAGHVREALGLIYNSELFNAQLLSGLRYKEIEPWGANDSSCFYLIASIMHHGKTYRLDGCEQYSKAIHWKPTCGINPFDGLKRVTDACFSIFPNLRSDLLEDKLPDSSYFQYMFSGLVCLADWIASDTRFFSFSQAGEDRATSVLPRIPEALKAIGVETCNAQDYLANAGYDLPGIFNFPLYEIQKVTAQMPIVGNGSITILESATGSGKTEACFGRFLRLMEAGAVDGMYFALPTRTAATQIFERIRGYVAKSFPDDKTRPPVILAVPGYLKADDQEGQKLPGFKVLWSDDEVVDDRLRLRGWAAENPKRYLAGSIIVGTIDQILLSQLAVKHSLLRAAALQRLFLVVDEVHASDEYMNRILKFVLQTHIKSAGHSLLMSATLGCEMAETYLGIAGKKIDTLSLEIAAQRNFPLLVSKAVNSELVQIALPPAGEKKVVAWRTELLDFENTARLALEKAKLGGRVLIIRNTVGDCIKTQYELEKIAEAEASTDCLFRCSGLPAPHHSRFVPDDRKKLDLALEKSFGKGSKAEGCVVCATQTVQQSLDIDADFMITDLAPMDVLLQRIGRLHRHVRADRNPMFKEPVCIVNKPRKGIGKIASEISTNKSSDYIKTEMGLGVVYENLVTIEATRQQIEKHKCVTIPDMNRELIENTMHSEALKMICDSAECFNEQMKLVRGKAFGKSTGAALNRFEWENPLGEYNSGDVKDEKIQTRLGEGDRCAIFSEATISAFNTEFKQISIPAFMAKGVSSDTEPVVSRRLDGELSFSLGLDKFVYDRLGLRKLPRGE
ncbi:MAG: CRISPR-associated helicase/endonuclease Cas3 [Candidatus Riflebacteria bacterium HGW-Riflebacteria-1]|jgi:CRISPR-associated endonuclease/helicase Cas3|nr:MAG: CRISPR-associated helicase/endonuclease Cas3 [Candidatus Riflebacteria bacterium HGW-Riflebacteria-1]